VQLVIRQTDCICLNFDVFADSDLWLCCMLIAKQCKWAEVAFLCFRFHKVV